jgi:glucokinase
MAFIQALTIGIDIGGTKVAAGVVDPEGNVLDRLRRDTPTKDPRETEDAIAEVVDTLEAKHDVIAVGIGAAGFVDGTRSSVLFAPHLAWRHEPLRDAVERRLGLPVVVENDANAAAWSEWRFGAGQGESHLVCVTLGTGIGGAILNDGALQRGKFGIAGEFGHMQVVPGGHRCECGNRGCWEQYASGNALVREARELAASGSPVAHNLLRRVSGDPSAITGPLVTELAKDGDPVAVELLEDVGRWLGIGLANLAAALDPGTFVIGGGVCDAGELLLAPARESFHRTLTGRGFRPEARVVRAVLGPEAGMVGAADLAREEATWLRRVRVKTTAVTAKTAARAGRSERAAARAERVAKRTSMLGGSRRAALRAEAAEDLDHATPPLADPPGPGGTEH